MKPVIRKLMFTLSDKKDPDNLITYWITKAYKGCLLFAKIIQCVYIFYRLVSDGRKYKNLCDLKFQSSHFLFLVFYLHDFQSTTSYLLFYLSWFCKLCFHRIACKHNTSPVSVKLPEQLEYEMILSRKKTFVRCYIFILFKRI